MRKSHIKMTWKTGLKSIFSQTSPISKTDRNQKPFQEPFKVKFDVKR